MCEITNSPSCKFGQSHKLSNFSSEDVFFYKVTWVNSNNDPLIADAHLKKHFRHYVIFKKRREFSNSAFPSLCMENPYVVL